jgi:hypothetical protein
MSGVRSQAGQRVSARVWLGEKTMSPKEEDFIRFYRDAVIVGDDGPRHFNHSRDYVVRLLNETIAGCEGQDIRDWKSGER